MWKNGWHFVGETLRDGQPIPPDGEWLEHDGELVMCESGLHASKKITDALKYAPGNTICRVRLAGRILEDDDKMVATERKILWRVDGEALLRAFARWAALQSAAFWDPPEVVLDYLRTGREEIRAAAWDAARAAARDAAWDAARDAARAVAWDVAWDIARAAARDAARNAALDAARDIQEKQLVSMLEEAREGKTEWVFKVADVGSEDEPPF